MPKRYLDYAVGPKTVEDSDVGAENRFCQWRKTIRGGSGSLSTVARNILGTVTFTEVKSSIH